MRQASIGHHCPECLSQGNQQVYTARNLPGGSNVTVATALMALNVVLYMAQIATGDRLTVEGLLYGPAVAGGEWWRIVTSGFLHGSLMHLAFNMYGLWVLGRPLEEGLGKARFALIYLAGLLGGSLAVLAIDFAQPTLGASGAVLGLAGAMAAVLWARGVPLTQSPLTLILVMNLALPLLVPRISFAGHLGGIAAGFAAGWLLSWLPMRFGRSQSSAVSATAGLCVALLVGVVAVAGAGGLF
jgi:membrane associated rhomboid family serine protease